MLRSEDRFVRWNHRTENKNVNKFPMHTTTNYHCFSLSKMECSLNSLSLSSPVRCSINRRHNFGPLFAPKPFSATHPYSDVSRSFSLKAVSSSKHDVHNRSSLESLFCYDKAIPEEIIEEPVGLSLAEKYTGDNPRCADCEAKGAVLCTTCSGSGLYVESILESQGIIVKVRCLGCGGSGNIMCLQCHGRGHH